MSGIFVFLFLVVCIQLAFADGHHRCRSRHRHRCGCDEEEEETSSPVQTSPSTESSSVPPSSVPQTVTSKSTKVTTAPPPTTKSTVTQPKSTATTVKSTSKSTKVTTAPPPTTKSTSTTKKTCSCSPCQSGYTAYNKNCYKLHWTDSLMTHDEADQMCRQDNTNLVSIHSYEEHKWIFDFVTKTTGYGDNFEVYKAAGKVAEGFWIGIKSINGNDDSKRQMYWSDKPGVYLKSGDYGYDRYKLPWAHGPDRNLEWTKCSFMWIVDPRPQHERGSWDDAACNSTDNASDQYSKGHVCKTAQVCNC